MGKLSFTKQERLNKEIWIRDLFEKGSSFNLYPFRIVFLPHPDPASLYHQILISVSARNFKRAVDRNLLKRRIREAWRLNKPGLISGSNLLIAYIYVARELLEFTTIESSMQKGFQSLISKRGFKN